MAIEKIIEFECIIENLIFPRNINEAENDYKIYAVQVNKEKYPNIKFTKYGNATIVGDLHELGIGARYKVKAIEQNTARGYNYKVKNIGRDRPNGEIASKLFLYEILSEKQADTLIDVYPDIIERVINNDLDGINLNKTKGIKEYTFNVIKRKIEENFVFAEIIDLFDGLLDLSILKKLYDKYPSSILIKEAIETKPYQTLCGISRVAFKTADSILLLFEKELNKLIKDGGSPNIKFTVKDLRSSIDRCYGAVEFLLLENSSNGNTRMDLLKLKKEITKLTPECSQYLKDVVKYNDFYIDKETKSIALKSSYETELKISNILKNMLKSDSNMNISENEILSYKSFNEFNLTDTQINALRNLTRYSISALIGVAGSGKTMSTQPIIKFMDDHNMTYKILAPTGRASKVIASYTDRNAYTIHRGLGFKGEWEYNENNKLDVDVIIIDESSMLDIHLALRVLEATNQNKTKLFFIGDNEQLPSVGEGNFLHDLIHSKQIPLTMLTEVFRYGSGGMLTVATDIRKGNEFIKSRNKINKFGDDESYVYIPTSQQKIKATMIAVYKKLIKSGKSPADIMVLTSYNKGEYGTIQINKELQAIANKNYGSSTVATVGGDKTNYYIGDIVMQYTNNYRTQIYLENNDSFGFTDTPTCFISNGDIGVIKDIINTEDGMLVIIQFDDFLISYHKTELMSNICLAYSIGIFKSQGGSVDTALLLVPKAHTYMLNSNILYVGSTRARERVYCIGEPDTINRAIKKKANFERKTFLKELLQKT